MRPARLFAVYSHISDNPTGLSASKYVRTSALSILWNNIHIAVGGVVTLSAMFTSGSRPISAKPSSPDRFAVGPLDHTRGSGDEVLLPAFLRLDDERRPDVSILRFNLHSLRPFSVRVCVTDCVAGSSPCM